MNLMHDYENYTDEELDELFRPKKSNSRKSLAPLFVYMILTDGANAGRKFSQKELAEKLEEYPYEIEVERKAISRIIHNLEDTGFGITSSRKGVWFDEENIWA